MPSFFSKKLENASPHPSRPRVLASSRPPCVPAFLALQKVNFLLFVDLCILEKMKNFQKRLDRKNKKVFHRHKKISPLKNPVKSRFSTVSTEFSTRVGIIKSAKNVFFCVLVDLCKITKKFFCHKKTPPFWRCSGEKFLHKKFKCKQIVTKRLIH